MKRLFLLSALSSLLSVAVAGENAITVYQDPNCGCCTGWADHMRAEGFTVKTVKTAHMSTIKQKLGVPLELGSCHTAVNESTGQIVEGHVPAAAVKKLLANSAIRGVSAPGMPQNSPGMGEMDGNLVTVDFGGNFFSRD